MPVASTPEGNAMRSILLLLASLLLSSFAFAQNADRVSKPGEHPVLTNIHGPRWIKLPPGKTATDGTATIENGGTNANGRLWVRSDKKWTRDANGNYSTQGTIDEVKNPASQGSDGPISVNTGGNDIEVNLNRNGQSGAGNGISSTITGGSATVNVNGNYNNTTVGGTQNNVNMNGNHNTGTGQNAGSQGNVTSGGSNNSFNSNGGNWNFRS